MELGSTPQQQQQQQQAVDLSLYLFDRPLHPELFTVHDGFRVSQGRYHADIWVVGLSHVVSITEGGQTLTELVAKESESLPTRGVLTRFKLKGERDHERTGPDGWLYLVSSQVEMMDEALYKSVHFDLLRHATRKGCCVTYDDLAEGEMAPFTHIDTEARDREFHIHAFHAFPAERTIVKTQSLFEMTN